MSAGAQTKSLTEDLCQSRQEPAALFEMLDHPIFRFLRHCWLSS